MSIYSGRMSSFISRAIGVTALAVFAVSCSVGPENAKLIPSEARIVTTIDFASIGTKGKLSQLDQLGFFNDFKMQMASSNESLGELLDNMLADPYSVGIDWTAKAVGFGYAKDNQQYSALSFAVKDPAMVESFFTTVFEGINMPVVIEHESDYTYFNVPMTMARVYWNDGTLLLLVSPGNTQGVSGLDAEYARLTMLSSDEALLTKDEFKGLYNAKDDVNFWMTTELLADVQQLASALPMGEAGDMFNEQMAMWTESESFMMAHLNFEKDDVVMSMEIDPTGALKEQFDSYLVDESFTEENLKFFPAETYVLLTGKTNTSAYAEAIAKMTDFDKATEEVSKKLGVGFEEIINSLGGEFAMSVSGINTVPSTVESPQYDIVDGQFAVVGTQVDTIEENLPVFAALVSLKNKDVITRMMDSIPDGMLVSHENYYELVFQEEGSMPFFFSYNDNNFYMSNEETYVLSFNNGGLEDESLVGTEYGKKVLEHNSYFYADLDLSHYPESLAGAVNNKFLEQTSSVEIFNSGKYSGEIVVHFKASEENTLESFIKMMD